LEIYGDDYREAEKEEQYILATAFSEGIIANNTVQLLLDKNPLEVGKLLYALVGKNMLLSTNKGRWTTYSINTAYRQAVGEARRKVATSLTNCLITLLITFFKKIFLFEVFCTDNIKR
jgi:divergent AAA domain protein